MLSSVGHLTGFLVFITYAAHIFEQVGASQIDPNISSIAIAVVQLIGTLCTTRFSDTLGRKALLITSLLGTAFGMIVFALYSYLKHNGYTLSAFEWVPVASLSFVIFTASSGAVPLIFLCTAEGLPSKVFFRFFLLYFELELFTNRSLFNIFWLCDSMVYWMFDILFDAFHRNSQLFVNNSRLVYCKLSGICLLFPFNQSSESLLQWFYEHYDQFSDSDRWNDNMHGIHEFDIILHSEIIPNFDDNNWIAWLHADSGNCMYSGNIIRLFCRQRNFRYIDGFDWFQRSEAHRK